MNPILGNEPMFVGQPILAVAAPGGHYFNRTPVVADMIVNAASGREQSHRRLQVSTA